MRKVKVKCAVMAISYTNNDHSLRSCSAPRPGQNRVFLSAYMMVAAPRSVFGEVREMEEVWQSPLMPMHSSACVQASGEGGGGGASVARTLVNQWLQFFRRSQAPNHA